MILTNALLLHLERNCFRHSLFGKSRGDSNNVPGLKLKLTSGLTSFTMLNKSRELSPLHSPHTPCTGVLSTLCYSAYLTATLLILWQYCVYCFFFDWSQSVDSMHHMAYFPLDHPFYLRLPPAAVSLPLNRFFLFQLDRIIKSIIR